MELLRHSFSAQRLLIGKEEVVVYLKILWIYVLFVTDCLYLNETDLWIICSSYCLYLNKTDLWIICNKLFVSK